MNTPDMPLPGDETAIWAIKILVLVFVWFAVRWAWDKMKGRDDD